jgi:hypothetical protein
VLANENKRIGQAVQRDRKAPPIASKHLLEMFQLLFMFLKGRHRSISSSRLPEMELHIGHTGFAPNFTASRARNIIR